jgi:hypothetical protein
VFAKWRDSAFHRSDLLDFLHFARPRPVAHLRCLRPRWLPDDGVQRVHARHRGIPGRGCGGRLLVVLPRTGTELCGATVRPDAVDRHGARRTGRGRHWCGEHCAAAPSSAVG